MILALAAAEDGRGVLKFVLKHLEKCPSKPYIYLCLHDVKSVHTGVAFREGEGGRSNITKKDWYQNHSYRVISIALMVIFFKQIARVLCYSYHCKPRQCS